MFTSGFSQITFSGCDGLFDTQTFTFNNLGDDGNGRNIFETTPIDGNQPCSGVGVCEFRISWNDTESRWEFIADDGNGGFSSPFLIYYNSAASLPNPSSLNLGTWVEASITSGNCGGNLTTSNGMLTGDVQNSVLSTDDFSQSELSIHPNPVDNRLFIEGISLNEIDTVSIYNILGKRIFSQESYAGSIDVSTLRQGVYFLKITLGKQELQRKIIIQ